MIFRFSECYNYLGNEVVVQYLVSRPDRIRSWTQIFPSELNCLEDSRICGSGLRPRVYPAHTDVPRRRGADRNEDADDRKSGKF